MYFIFGLNRLFFQELELLKISVSKLFKNVEMFNIFVEMFHIIFVEMFNIISLFHSCKLLFTNNFLLKC